MAMYVSANDSSTKWNGMRDLMLRVCTSDANAKMAWLDLTWVVSIHHDLVEDRERDREGEKFAVLR